MTSMPAGLPARATGQPRWGTGRILTLIGGLLLAVVSLGLLATGGLALWAGTAGRDAGYVGLGTVTYGTSGHAIVTGTVRTGDWGPAAAFAGTVRVRAVSTSGAPVFIGVAPAQAASGYLDRIGYATARGSGRSVTYMMHPGGAPAVMPMSAGIWAASAAGPGTQTLRWPVKDGDWVMVGMNRDGSAPVMLRLDLAATLPDLAWIAAGLLVVGAIVLAGGVTLIVRAAR